MLKATTNLYLVDLHSRADEVREEEDNALHLCSACGVQKRAARCQREECGEMYKDSEAIHIESMGEVSCFFCGGELEELTEEYLKAA